MRRTPGEKMKYIVQLDKGTRFQVSLKENHYAELAEGLKEKRIFVYDFQRFEVEFKQELTYGPFWYKVYKVTLERGQAPLDLWVIKTPIGNLPRSYVTLNYPIELRGLEVREINILSSARFTPSLGNESFVNLRLLEALFFQPSRIELNVTYPVDSLTFTTPLRLYSTMSGSEIYGSMKFGDVFLRHYNKSAEIRDAQEFAYYEDALGCKNFDRIEIVYKRPFLKRLIDETQKIVPRRVDPQQYNSEITRLVLRAVIESAGHYARIEGANPFASFDYKKTPRKKTVSNEVTQERWERKVLKYFREKIQKSEDPSALYSFYVSYLQPSQLLPKT